MSKPVVRVLDQGGIEKDRWDGEPAYDVVAICALFFDMLRRTIGRTRNVDREDIVQIFAKAGGFHNVDSFHWRMKDIENDLRGKTKPDGKRYITKQSQEVVDVLKPLYDKLFG